MAGKTRRLPADLLERHFRDSLGTLLQSRTTICDALGVESCARTLDALFARAKQRARHVQERPSKELRTDLGSIVERVALTPGTMKICLSRAGLRDWLGAGNLETLAVAEAWTVEVPCVLQNRGRQMRVIEKSPDDPNHAEPDPTLVKLLRRAHAWRSQLESDEAKPVGYLAKAAGVTSSYFTRVLRLAYLAPDIVEAILDGLQPPHLTATRLVSMRNLPIDWPGQRTRLGFPAT